MKITLPLFDLKYDKIEQSILHEFELLPTCLIYRLHCWLTMLPRKDDDVPVTKENQYVNAVCYLTKDAISNIDCSFEREEELWMITAYLTNGQSVDCKFETEREMREVEKELIKWRYDL